MGLLPTDLPNRTVPGCYMVFVVPLGPSHTLRFSSLVAVFKPLLAR